MCEKLEILKTGNSLRITELDHISQNPFQVGETKFLETNEVMCPTIPIRELTLWLSAALSLPAT